MEEKDGDEKPSAHANDKKREAQLALVTTHLRVVGKRSEYGSSWETEEDMVGSCVKWFLAAGRVAFAPTSKSPFGMYGRSGTCLLLVELWTVGSRHSLWLIRTGEGMGRNSI